MASSKPRNARRRKLAAAIFFLALISSVSARLNPSELPAADIRRRSGSPDRPARWGPPRKRDGGVPLVISNQCPDPIWPAIGTQAGTGAGTGGFLLSPGTSRSLTVGSDWQGRVWGRTNCSFNVAGNGASNLNGHNGAGAACVTGDCNGVLSCVVTGDTPVTLAEFDLAGGVGNKQTFYDISLVDGYNLPLGITYIPSQAADLVDIPPNLTNPACIATAGLLLQPAMSGTLGNSSNSSYPIPYESTQTSAKVASWCPWDLQVKRPTKPGDGVYPYPNDNIQRPIFDPCFSACAKTNSPSDCCTGTYNTPQVCKPTLYSTAAKLVCPDAYSYAYDDQTSTFIVPSGGGWQITFCPLGRSTNILKTFKKQLDALSQGVPDLRALQQAARNLTLIDEAGTENHGGRSRGERLRGASLCALVVVLAWAVLW
ncbi:hypothetical protein M430DRAFT_99823 [Amorphotheca resinae ATCC 22711]|uniref:Osmotin, thaumatin-like protein n=1 Tax=Amorphotheca resinae ATCC 22711 TaxID=857342 RepID=A0A2T3B5H3_AMORE|nr:hypothetical protein M430DRAFT_99823 [Amorphotheca resinae ATCC 22711]PSS21983.1 hypothetical protein M430DRAFT_99823 [Amorphotheca resinae ATCC 22711]